MPCLVCGSPEPKLLLDCGPQPICHRFLSDPNQDEYVHPMIVGQCRECALIQLHDPVPATEVVPRFDWVTYREPERHLDELAEIVSRLPGITPESVIGAVSYKDDSTVARLRARGFSRTWRIDPGRDLGLAYPRAGIESIQERFTSDRSELMVAQRGESDVMIVRHIFEHAHDPRRFAEALSRLLRRDGYLILEVPDCRRALEQGDFAMLWEEHVLYFTSETFRRTLELLGFSVVRFEVYPYPLENSLVAIGRPSRDAGMHPSRATDSSEWRRGNSYPVEFARRSQIVRDFLSAQTRAGKRAALFGAGHVACSFINLLKVREFLSFVVDDDPNKQGLFMPGSRLPIYTSAALTARAIDLCLLSLGPESEEKVVRKQSAFLERGGRFASVFPVGERALEIGP